MIDRLLNDNGYLFKVVAIATLALAVLWGCHYIMTYRADVRVTVTSIGWSTRIDVLRWQTNNRGGWYVPNGGRETDSYMKQSGTKRVPTGTRQSCTGSGKNRSCSTQTTYTTYPVYDRWYEFDIDEWTQIEPLTAAGTTHEWYMPDTTDGTWFDNTRAPLIGDKRLSTPYTHFYVIFHTKVDKPVKYPVDMVESMWQDYDVEDTAILTLDFFNGVKGVKLAGWN